MEQLLFASALPCIFRLQNTPATFLFLVFRRTALHTRDISSSTFMISQVFAFEFQVAILAAVFTRVFLCVSGAHATCLAT